MLFCCLKKGVENLHVVFVLINSILLNLLWVWIWFWNASSFRFFQFIPARFGRFSQMFLTDLLSLLSMFRFLWSADTPERAAHCGLCPSPAQGDGPVHRHLRRGFHQLHQVWGPRRRECPLFAGLYNYDFLLLVKQPCPLRQAEQTK